MNKTLTTAWRQIDGATDGLGIQERKMSQLVMLVRLRVVNVGKDVGSATYVDK